VEGIFRGYFSYYHLTAPIGGVITLLFLPLLLVWGKG